MFYSLFFKAFSYPELTLNYIDVLVDSGKYSRNNLFNFKICIKGIPILSLTFT
jgi:hypothetical protein